MECPEELKYTKEHEWVKIEGDVVRIGITDYAQESLGDVVFLELPEVGNRVEVGEAFGVVESVKAVSDLYSPINGDVTETNEPLIDAPEWTNDSPYGNGWMIAVKLDNKDELGKLMSAEEYAEFVKEIS